MNKSEKIERTFFVTITGLNHYYGEKPFEIGRIIKLLKEPDNEYDNEAIIALLPFIDKIGYVANSTNTVYKGTVSAGRIYDKFDDYTYARVMFVTHSSVIALVLDKDEVEKDDDNADDDDNVSTPPEKISVKLKKSNDKNPIGFME